MKRHLSLVIIPLVGSLVAFSCGSDDEVVPAADESEEAAGQDPSSRFLGLMLEEAVALAEEEGRPWRVGREDDELLALTADFVVGRVTFEVDDGMVTVANIEADDTPSPPTTAAAGDDVLAGLQAAAVERLVTVDNSFGGGGNPFQRVEVAGVIGGDPTKPLQPLGLELIAEALQASAEVTFVPDVDAAIDQLFDASPSGVAVVSIEALRIDRSRAEIDMRLWCGSLCGVFLTYEAELTDVGWAILGTTGPIAVS